MASKGVVAAGHPETAEAAAEVLRAGGNAFDAALAAASMACLAEPVLASLGGGGFLLARPAGGQPVVYDFFVQTPKARRPAGEIDFHPIIADFGTTTQEFHIGMGAVATPGMVRGLFDIHRDLGRMPMADVVAQTVHKANTGLPMNDLQAYILSVVGPIFRATDSARAIYAGRAHPDALLAEGEALHQPDMAAVLDVLAGDGDDTFYLGDIAKRIIADCRDNGGHLTDDDLAGYRVARRQPLQTAYGDWSVFANPPPSAGGLLIAFALKLLAGTPWQGEPFGTLPHLTALARVMDATNEARAQAGDPAQLQDEAYIERYRREVANHPPSWRGTTHINVIDAAGNAAAMSLSNGEGCGSILAGTGIMLNNMLGEEDLNPDGFGRWPLDSRMSSMMTPALLLGPEGEETVMGSGGSNRIRTAILQVIVNLIGCGLPVEQAVRHPRLHFERGELNAEPGFAAAVLDALEDEFPHQTRWQDRNMFFGGVHTACFDPRAGAFDGTGDPRRGGVCQIV